MLSFVQFAEFNIVFMFSPAILAFDVEADLQVNITQGIWDMF